MPQVLVNGRADKQLISSIVGSKVYLILSTSFAQATCRNLSDYVSFVATGVVDLGGVSWTNVNRLYPHVYRKYVWLVQT